MDSLLVSGTLVWILCLGIPEDPTVQTALVGQNKGLVRSMSSYNRDAGAEQLCQQAVMGGAF